MSDSHGNERVLENIAKKEEKAEIFVHLGDTEREAAAFMRKNPAVDFRYVRGNNDYNSSAPLQIVVDVPGARILCVHGNRHGVYYGTDILAAAAANLGCNIACFGHTHRYFEDYVNGIYLLNPGSSARPRDSLVPSYAFIDITNAGIVIGKKDI
ncbi:MAG: YfcE family phosphodiesterase [Ruminococcus sp.]|jgi:putative phosphoesterase|nr:YfcE family phosphodiesterase [Ruminococcus sp.]